MYLREGIHDRNIFKAIFICGVPGAGKNFILDKLNLVNNSMKIVDVDYIQRFLQRVKKSSSYEEAGNYQYRFQTQYSRSFLGLVVLTTGRLFQKTISIANELENNGYDTMMVFVNTSKETAIQRIINRGRQVDRNYFDESWKQVESNFPMYKLYFGEDFVVIDNEKFPNIQLAYRKVRQFLSLPINKKAQEILQKQNVSARIQ
ncbi:Zeta toxin [uncultured archaeon]|nr:Zeta toxin [uncultured archaeon]